MLIFRDYRGQTSMKRTESNALHKKRFGQYFSGRIVADMLFSLLPNDHDWETVIDPMVGIGDMLVSVKNHATTPHMLGVEIDKAVAKECAIRLPNATIITGDTFKVPEVITAEGWDLVITNPPYVRYQLQDEDDDTMPSSQEIRKNLINQIEAIPYLSDAEKALFLSLSENYSGLADMAVPAWILCAALVKKNGYLAVVVPETWLNRDYAAPIQYLLMKLFQIETITRDTNASWFPEALVKTCLVVARRIDMRDLIEASKHTTRIIGVDRDYSQQTTALFPQLRVAKGAKKWVDLADGLFFTSRTELPHELKEILGKNDAEYMSLADMEIECGQGLRTGANDFFYVAIEKDEGETYSARSKIWDQGGKVYSFSKDDILLTLQNRGEIDGLVVCPDKLVTGVLYPQGKIRGQLKDYITRAEDYRDGKNRRFKDFSAVKPNEKTDGTRIIREWFRLPKMAKRHLPNLCLTRVSANTAECLYVQQSTETPIAIDANMVTLWSKNERNILGAFALLNSTWSKLSLELICTVMGGGALKVEASHLKKLLLPKLPEDKLDELKKAGLSLVAEGKMTQSEQEKIDNIVASAFGDNTVTARMQQLLTQKHKERSTRL